MSGFRPRPGADPRQEGNRFEKFWARLFSVKVKPGSGNQWWAPLDVGDISFLFSCKWTSKKSFTIDRAQQREVADKINAPGGAGGDTIGGWATAVDGGSDVFVTFRAEDFLRLIHSPGYKYLVPTKAEQKRALSRVPALMREDFQDD